MKAKTSRRQFLRSAAVSSLWAALPAFSQNHDWERRFFADPDTGVRIMQATSAPTVNMNLYFRSRCWTPDANIFLFWSMTRPKRSGIFDLYRMNVDGSNMVQMTEGKLISNVALQPDGGLIYFTSNDTIYSLDLLSRKEKRIASLKHGVTSGGIGSFTDDGRRFCFNAQLGEKRYAIAYLDIRSSKVTILPKYFSVPTHPQIEPAKGHLINYISEKNEQGYSLYVIDENGDNEQALPILDVNGHVTWLGGSGKICAAVTGDSRGIFVAAPGDSKPILLTPGPPNYWHPGCNPAGHWIVSDSNAPDDGLYLVSVATGRRCRLARSKSDNGHAQWSHPHPSVSPDAKYVVFNSTRTGVPHVYVAEIPEQMKKSLQVPFQVHQG
jgi:oligogalacturonide lyase